MPGQCSAGVSLPWRSAHGRRGGGHAERARKQRSAVSGKFPQTVFELHLRAVIGRTNGDSFFHYFVLITLATRCWLPLSWPVILLEITLRLYCFPSTARAHPHSSAAAGDPAGKRCLSASWATGSHPEAAQNHKLQSNGCARGAFCAALRRDAVTPAEVLADGSPASLVQSSSFLPASGLCCAAVI